MQRTWLFLVLVVGLGWWGSPAWGGRLLEIHFLDVGQGDGMLVRTPSGREVLIDVGTPRSGPRLARYLRRSGVRRLNLFLISHPHADHIGGYKHILRAFSVRTYIDPGFAYPSNGYRRLLHWIKRKKVRRFSARGGQILDLGGGARFRVLAPSLPMISGSRSDANANSVVLRLEYGRLRVLFTGDAEAETEQRLLKKPEMMPSHILKVAHHGSRYATSRLFLRAVRPQFAVVSCGRNNDYGHPHPHTLARLKKVGARIYRTDQQGDIIFKSDGKRLWISLWGRGRSRPKRVKSVPLRRLPKRWITAAEGQSYHPPFRRRSPARQRDVHRMAYNRRWRKWMTVRPSGREMKSTSALSRRRSPGGYVSSRHSSIFHRARCRFVRLIPKKKRIYYKTRREAIRRGKHPASGCQP